MSSPVASLYLAVLKMPDDSLALAATPGVASDERLVRKIHALQLLAAMVACELAGLPSSDPLGAVGASAAEAARRCKAFSDVALSEARRALGLGARS